MIEGLVEVKEEGCRWLRRGALHVYAQNVLQAKADKGDFVEVKCGDFSAYGFYNPDSSIAVKVISWQEENPWEVVAGRIEALWKEKSSWGWDAFRWVFAEGDLLPGLVVDVYRDVVVFKIHDAGLERMKVHLVELLSERFDSVVERNDDSGRDKEKLPRVKRIWKGSPETEIREGEATFFINTVEGQKTGFYLDQRENRLLSSEFAVDAVLDVFSYTGGFGIHLGLKGARVTFVEQGVWERHMIKRHMEVNGVEGEIVGGDAVDVLKKLERKGQRFDAVVIDPPALIKDRTSLVAGKKTYFLLNRLAIRLIRDEGLLFTSSCSHFLNPKDFLGIVKGAAEKEGVKLKMLGSLRGQARDHSVYIHQPETLYLKFGVFRVKV